MTEGVRAVQISGTKRDEVLRVRVAKLMKVAVNRVTVRPVRVQAVFFDDNGPKGGQAMRCALTAGITFSAILKARPLAKELLNYSRRRPQAIVKSPRFCGNRP